jgi:hypothetical protein
MEDLREQGGEFPDDLLFQAVGEPLPDALGGSVHVPSHSFIRASNASRAALVNVVRKRQLLSTIKLVAWTGRRRRMKRR